MPTPRCLLLSAALAPLLVLSATAASSQTRIVPADPVQFERVSLRQTVDSCTFDEDSVSVSLDRSTLVVLQPPLHCFAPGPPEVVDIQLGAFPPGDYRVEIYHSQQQPPIERIDFTVSAIARIAIFPPPPFPLADYSGVWWNTSESGWGLSLHQGRFHELFGAIYVFGTDRQPEWYTLQSGQWVTSTRWTGDVGKASGSPWSAPSFDARGVQHAVVGTATLDFTMAPGQEDRVALTYTIDGTTVTKTISRYRF